MDTLPIIRTLAPAEWAVYKDLRLRALADSPDAFGGTLAAEQDRSDVEWQKRLASGSDSRWNLPLLAEAGGKPVGLAWCRIVEANPEVANLYQMWVAPDHRGVGIGQMLLDTAIAWARANHALYLDLGVTYRDSPAMRLYTRRGFKPLGPPQPLRPGSDLLGLEMRLILGTAAA
jgi:GNAT superfamily N-acetyltransferase